MSEIWAPPADWIRITTLEVHTAGEPLRIITGGIPPIPGSTILEKRRYAREHMHALRTALMWEPRGHADMYGCVVVPAISSTADFGVLFVQWVRSSMAEARREDRRLDRLEARERAAASAGSGDG